MMILFSRTSWLLLLSMGLLGACHGQEPGYQTSTDTTAAVLLPGKALFEQNCALCHGSDGKRGLNGAHDLTKSNLNQAGRVYMVTNGLGNMPAFKNQLSPEQIEQVAAYSLTLQ
ncbi:cytochrome c [Hymenobacter sp. BT18]|uniref:c-type cytochrome n=1 Tax=Hymenobacter sp. BT18 TaxID=2835648 RepID=UPI00143ECC2E|nr:c-type cytochrome [Hymenobacter sp. BT18]QIX61886.1 cytochrome c [Hymenobacter sp. BT18]